MSRTARRDDGLRKLPWWGALPAAAAGGYLLDVASPDLAWWPAAFVGVALVLAAVWHQRPGLATHVGLVAGAAFWGPHIFWLTLYLGPVPWLGLAGLMTLWFGAFGLFAGPATRVLAGVPLLADRPWRVIPAQAFAVAGLWVLREQLQGSWPYGGFPWGRLAHMQTTGPLLESVSWLGFAGLSGAVALLCGLVVAALAMRTRRPGDGAGNTAGVAGAIPAPSARSGSRERRVRLVLGGAVPVLLFAALALVPAFSLQQTGTIRVAAIQGNSKSGIFDDRESGDVLRDHVEETERLLDRLEAADESVDLIVWPENSAEFDLPGDAPARSEIQRLAKRAGAPILLGSILQNSDGSYTNSSLVWTADGDAGVRYDKRYPVPFAEYMPNRDFFHALAPDLVDLVQLEYTPGVTPPVLDIDIGDGSDAATIRAGVAICFDIIFDQQAVAMVDEGADVILAQTNNADFGRTDESAQQLAIARLRSMETGRALVNISTVGTSAVIDTDGRALDELTPHTADALVAEVPLVEGETPALLLGSAVAAAWMAIGGVAVVAAVGAPIMRRLARSRGSAETA